MASRKISFALVLVLGVLSLSGCAAFRWGEDLPPVLWPISKEPGKQSISLLVTGEGSFNGASQDAQRAIATWQEAAARAYKDSGLFSDVKIGAAETDLRAEIHFIDRGQGNLALAVISGLTMTVIPAKGQDEFTVKTTLKNKAGQDLGTFEKKDTVSRWFQLFLIFLMPYNWPNTVVTELLYDLNRDTINQAFGAGLLHSRHVTVPIEWARTAE
jgi:hypothetical protein